MPSTNKTKLVRLAAVLALLGTASFGAMAEWTKIGADDQFTAYVDFSTIRRSGRMVKMWVLYDYKSPEKASFGNFLSLRARQEYDCSDERSRVLDLSSHTERMGRGRTLVTDSTTGQWSSVAPRTPEKAFLIIACGSN